MLPFFVGHTVSYQNRTRLDAGFLAHLTLRLRFCVFDGEKQSLDKLQKIHFEMLAGVKKNSLTRQKNVGWIYMLGKGFGIYAVASIIAGRIENGY